ncbi:RhoGAP-domain-containing protein [Stipitochalara longipes BDJ]|nr:RhoGAP-domain-containing protein [Stipitochalara longipes BDJ]
MASDIPASSTSQQPFANPQPAPVPNSTVATSPPTKQSLKSWWKTFGKATKNQDTHGNAPPASLQQHLHHKRPCQPPSKQHPSKRPCLRPDQYSPPTSYVGELYARREFTPVIETSGPRKAKFTEHHISKHTPAIDGLSTGKDKKAPAVAEAKGLRRSFSFSSSIFDNTQRPARFLPQRRHSSLLAYNPRQMMRQKRSQSMLIQKSPSPMSPSVKRDKFARRCNSSLFISPLGDESSEALSAGILPDPKRHVVPRIFDRVAQKMKSYTKALTEPQQAPGIFGVPLRQSITYANVAISLVDGEGKSYIYGYVPIVVAKCGVYLKEKATNVEGIFRLSGSEKRIKELKLAFDSPDRYGKGLDWAGYTVHDAANVLRRYLNNLPEPIVPLDLYDQFRKPLVGHTKEAVGDQEGPQLQDDFDANKAIVTYQHLITELPPLNRQLLLYILDLLAVFASKSDENRMTSANLAAIFQPGILSHPDHDMKPEQYRLSQDVLIFLIENQDHFLIGMRGTAADEKTVQEVQNGGTPPIGTPNTPGKSNAVARSSSNASAGADSVRKYGGIRRNVSVSSRHSRQSNGAPSPASPALATTPTGGVHRSNTVPSKRSPGLPSNRLQKNSGSPSPTTGVFASNQQAAPRGLSPAAAGLTAVNVTPASPGAAPVSSLAPSSNAASTVTSQDRLLGDQPDISTPNRERNVSNFFQRSPTMESEKKAPNKLRKKRVPGSSNPSAQSSTHSLTAQQSGAASPGLPPAHAGHETAEYPQLESIPSINPTTDATPPLTETPRADQHSQFPTQHEDSQQSERTLKPASPASSLHSRSSFNDQSDIDHHDTTAINEQKEKRSRWRLSRQRDDSQSLGHSLTPTKKGIGSDAGAGASSSSIGSSARPRKSFTGDTVPIGSDSTLIGTHLQSSNDSGSAGVGGEDKKSPFGWIKNKMREKREENREKGTEKERNKSPPASTERLGSLLPTRGKSMDVKREENPEGAIEEKTTSQAQQSRR